MSALKRLLTGQYKLQKRNSLPTTADETDYVERVNIHERSQSKPTTPVSSSTPTYNTGFPISGSPIRQSFASSSTTSSISSSNNATPRQGRSRSRAHAKHERAKSLEARTAQSTQDSIHRAERRKNSYERASFLLFYTGLCDFLSSSALSGSAQG